MPTFIPAPQFIEWCSEERRLLKYNQLAQYNAEVARGLLHTADWTAQMVEAQKQYDLENYEIFNDIPHRIAGKVYPTNGPPQ